MKKLIIILFMFGVAHAQTIPGYNFRNSRERTLAQVMTDGLHIPSYCGFPYVRTGVWVADGQIGMDTCNNKLYIYSGGTWRAWADSASLTGAGWLLHGNTGATPATNWIGTNDNNMLRFKVNGVITGMLTPQNSYVSIDSAGDASIYFGPLAGKKDTIADLGGNIGIGAKVLENKIGTGNQNIGIGHMVLNHLTSQGSNTAVGYKSAMDMISGFRNSYFGIHTGLRTTTAEKNSFFGAMAGELNTTGSYNEFFGQGAGRTCTGCTVNTGIGTQALYGSTGSVLSVTITSSVGIWTTGAATFSAPVHFGTGFDPTIQATGTLVTAGGAVTGVTITEPGIGYQSGATVTITGDGTSATGTVAVVYGSFNVGLGADVGFYNRAGWYNTNIGYRAGYVSGRYYDSSNVFLGKMATIDATAAATHINHLTVIGTDATGLQSNSIILGRVTAVAQDRVGIGTFAPNNRFHVNGRMQGDSGLLFTATTNPGISTPFGAAYISIPSLSANGYFPALYAKNASSGSNASIAVQMDNDVSHTGLIEIDGSNKTANGCADGLYIGTVSMVGGIKIANTVSTATIKFGFQAGSTNAYTFWKDSMRGPLPVITEAADSNYMVVWNDLSGKFSRKTITASSGGSGITGLTIGTTPITSGGAKRVLIHSEAGNVVNESANFIYDSTAQKLIVGGTAAGSLGFTANDVGLSVNKSMAGSDAVGTLKWYLTAGDGMSGHSRLVMRNGGSADVIKLDAGGANYINTGSGLHVGGNSPDSMITITGGLRINNGAAKAGYLWTANNVDGRATWKPQTTYVNAGNYTPTVTNTTNITASTPHPFQYLAITDPSSGEQDVSFSGSVSITNTLAVASEFQITLPIASGFAAATEGNGVGNSDATLATNVIVKADAATDRLSITFTSVSVGASAIIYITGHYKVTPP